MSDVVAKLDAWLGRHQLEALRTQVDNLIADLESEAAWISAALKGRDGFDGLEGSVQIAHEQISQLVGRFTATADELFATLERAS